MDELKPHNMMYITHYVLDGKLEFCGTVNVCVNFVRVNSAQQIKY